MRTCAHVCVCEFYFATHRLLKNEWILYSYQNFNEMLGCQFKYCSLLFSSAILRICSVHDHWIFFTNFWFDDIFTQSINMKCAAFKQYNLWFSDRNDLSTLSGKKTCQTSMCIFCCYHLTILNILRVRFCLTSNRRTFFFPGTENLNFGD